VFSAAKAALVLLRRLVYPMRLTDLVGDFERDETSWELSNFIIGHIMQMDAHRLENNLAFLKRRSPSYARVREAGF
jgi:hypothetical protein